MESFFFSENVSIDQNDVDDVDVDDVDDENGSDIDGSNFRANLIRGFNTGDS